MVEHTIKIYETANGKRPFTKWLNDLSDLRARVAIELRIDRLLEGNWGHIKSLRGGLYELKIDVGPGYRIYFGQTKEHTILLLCAGDKRSQKKDILKAREYLEDYKLWEKKK